MSNPEEDFVQTTDNFIRARLIHVLTLYPGISPSMLQVGIGTAISPKMWHPIMAQLKSEGLVKEEEIMAQAPNGRDLTYKKLVLASHHMLPIFGATCPECGADMFDTPSGVVCKDGHGGVVPNQDPSKTT